MTTLHLGVFDLPYSEAPAAGAEKVENGTQTTGDVAGWLEDRYGIMQTFFDHREEAFAKSFENSVSGAIETLFLGGPLNVDPFGTATSDIETEFRAFLDSGEIERLGIPGVPTKASIKRRSHRFKSKKNPKTRPSFIDTGLYESTFKSWVGDNTPKT